MTSRERVVAAINHREPDRVPVDFNPLLDFYLNLKSFLKIEIDEKLTWNSAMEVVPCDDVLELIGIDLTSVKLAAGPAKPKGAQPEGLSTDAWGVVRKRVAQARGSYMETVRRPLENATIADLEKYPWPRFDMPGMGEETEKAAKRKFEDTDLALVGRFGGPIMETCIELVGFDRWFTGLVAEPEFIDALLRHVTDACIQGDITGVQAAARYIQVLKVSGEDLGAQGAPLYSLSMFEKQLLPHLGRRWKEARRLLNDRNRDVKIMLHSCGSIRPFIPLLIESGIDILDPVQPRALHMDSRELKREYGAKMSFHGGVDIQYVMPKGTREEVLNETRKRIADYGPGGGFILATSHNVQADVPPESFMAMMEALKTWGKYPLEPMP